MNTAAPQPDRFQCPLDDCPWTFDAPPLFDIPPGATEDDLAEIGRTYNQTVQSTLDFHFQTHPIVEWVNEVSRLRQLLLQKPPLVCLGCFMDRHRAQKAGQPQPPLNLAQIITPQGGFCPGHVRVTDGPVMPGRTESGLILGSGYISPADGAPGMGI